MLDLPNGFVFLTDVDPRLIESTRYYGSENFIGRPVPGYTTPRIIGTQQLALKLKAINDEFREVGYTLVVYDAYRPQRAVNAFIEWSEDPTDQVAKNLYYPSIDKPNLFDLGYLAKKSGHSRGSTVDLTLIPIDQGLQAINVATRSLTNGEEIPFLDDGTLDMGTHFDFLHDASHQASVLVTQQQRYYRVFLREVMDRHGFKGARTEWWHYTLVDEPYPDTYFDFVV
jgi:D-alanyl-D-alanine dipeptidase